MAKVIAAKYLSVNRAKTAIRRYQCSKPVALAMSSRLITRDTSVFDFGCGHGGDIRYLSREKIKATGWDPSHAPKKRIETADVVNLGYVLNVIEKVDERKETLLRAFGLARDLLVVSVRVDQGIEAAEQFGDGVITSKGTFQKIFTQAEFKHYVETALNWKVYVAGLGILYVFKNPETESRYVASQAFSRRLEYRADLLDEFIRNPIAKRFVALANKFGRVPLPSEFKSYSALIEHFGSPHRIERLTLAKIDPAAYEGTRAQRREDILTYIAMIRLQGLKLPPVRSLPVPIQADIKALWPDYSAALDDAEEFLFSIGRPDHVQAVFQGLSVGKLVFDDLYIHRSLEDDLPPLVRLITFAARQIVGDVGDNVIKMSIDGRKVSFLSYENFDEDPHPALKFSVRVYLPKATYQVRNFADSLNPPILHRKDTLVSKSYPYYGVFKHLSAAEETEGLLSQIGIGFRSQWAELLASKQLSIVGHDLRKGPAMSAQNRTIEELVGTPTVSE